MSLAEPPYGIETSASLTLQASGATGSPSADTSHLETLV